MAVKTFTRVALARAGTHNASTGRARITVEDLREMVRAAADPQTGRSVIKIGHLDPRFRNPQHDGEPVYGQVQNLTVEGDVLYGDMVNVPESLAEAMPSAYPSRSVEVNYNFRTAGGKTYRRVLSAVALLGATPPAIRDLADIAATHASAAPDEGAAEVVLMSALDDADLPPSAPPVADDDHRDDPNPSGDPMTVSVAVLNALGLAEDADEAAVLAKISALNAPPAAPGTPPAPPVVTEGEGAGRHAAPEVPVVPVDLAAAAAASGGVVLTPAQVATFSEMATALVDLQTKDAKRTQEETEARIDAVVLRFSADPTDGGRITPVTEPLWRTQLARDFDGTVALLSASPRLYSPNPIGDARLGIPSAAVDPKTSQQRAMADAAALGLRVFVNPTPQIGA